MNCLTEKIIKSMLSCARKMCCWEDVRSKDSLTGVGCDRQGLVIKALRQLLCLHSSQFVLVPRFKNIKWFNF